MAATQHIHRSKPYRPRKVAPLVILVTSSFEVEIGPVTRHFKRSLLFKDGNGVSDRHATRWAMTPTLPNRIPDFVREFCMARSTRSNNFHQQANRRKLTPTRGGEEPVLREPDQCGLASSRNSIGGKRRTSHAGDANPRTSFSSVVVCVLDSVG